MTTTEQITFNNYREQMTEDDISQLFDLLVGRSHAKNRETLAYRLANHMQIIPRKEIFDSIVKDNRGWAYWPHKHYLIEIKACREIIINLR